jgi:phosphoglycerate dehydrogenase-like enzyme
MNYETEDIDLKHSPTQRSSSTATKPAGSSAQVETRPILLYSGPMEAEIAVREAVGEHFRVLWVEPEVSHVSDGLAHASAFLDASMKTRISSAMIEAAPHLRVVATATTGADHIDQKALQARDIPLLTLKGQTEVLGDLTPAAEHSWLLLMACARHLRAATEHVLHGGWNRTEFPGTMLKGRTIGIIGCGRIGGWMARYAQAFGMRILGHDPYLKEWPPYIEQTPLDELLSQADFVTLHVHLSEESKGMLNRASFERMKPGCVFVNTSRGDLTDEEALLDGLRSGHIVAAGLDVLAGEPDVANHPLRLYAVEHPNLIITPHIGGFSLDAVRVVVGFSAQRIMGHFGYAR